MSDLPSGGSDSGPTNGRVLGNRTRSAARDAATAVLETVDTVNTRTKASLGKLDKHRGVIADRLDTVAKAARVAAYVAGLGAAIAAPTGLAAVGVAIGVISAPLIVTAAPVLAGVALAAAAASAAASLYKKARKRRPGRRSDVDGSLGPT